MQRSQIFLALDFPSGKETLEFLEKNELSSVPVKIGMELFYQEGPSIIETLLKKDHLIFLDLKLHDIPNTVQRAMQRLASLGVSMVNVHAAGGQKMMEAAKEGLIKGTPHGKNLPLLIGVTQLTSTTEDILKKDLLINASLQETVQHYASISSQAGADGVVCSVHEIPLIKERFGDDFLCVTPGIRLSNGEHHDQARVATPFYAREMKSDFIVVGRAVTQSEQPKEVYQHIKEQWDYENH
ncbi:orotidine-5'-phosphate decarboxylase [Bacillaceae bacterium S4-13-58]